MPDWYERAKELVENGCYESAKVVTMDGLRGLWPDRSVSDNGSHYWLGSISGEHIDEGQESDSKRA